MSELQKIRIKLKAYDHALLDQSAAKIVERLLRRQAQKYRDRFRFRQKRKSLRS